MPDSTSEACLKALQAALVTAAPSGATVVRNQTFPTRAPAAGLIILRDGVPGDPLITMSPLRYEYEHVADVDIIAATDATFDTLKQAVATALAADRFLGGLTFDLRARAPQKVLVRDVEGAEAIMAATVPVVLHYLTNDPLT